MEEYFKNTIKKFKSNDFNQIYIVLGNESCDLDSAVSSIVYAIFLYWQYNHIKCTVCTQHSEYTDDKIFIPVLDVDREDYPLKTEVVYCLQQHGITEDYLIFRDDIDVKTLTSKDIKITLVDHHIIASRYHELIPYVMEIIDHRPKDENAWRYTDIRSTMEIVGSCGTLVTQRIRDLSGLLGKSLEYFQTFPQCADMLHSVIILDTVNFSKQLNKTTPLDVNNVEVLESILKPEDCIAERQLKLDRLVQARSDVSSLTAAQLLRKDLKVVGDIFVPTFPILVEEFLERSEALEAVNVAMATKTCGLALLLGIDLKSRLRRDGAIICHHDPERRNQLSKLLQNWTNPSLLLEVDERENCTYFKVKNLSASRKQFIPILNEFLLNYNK